MRGYMILELDLPETPDGGQTFSEILGEIKTTLSEATIERVSRVHLAIGEEGLDDSVAYLRETG